ncbi:early nodulin-like protein 2 [Salvia splendens]|uniref:early nodulin-like protein 2 n=1 Tax=Salvia splendens TaxID=180675 RepID=UPI001C25DADC|nr:early nodulin-like protein 2 [Salvia splendens]
MGYDRRNWVAYTVLLCFLVNSSHSYQLSVGGKDGWVLNPSESYHHWATRLRFQVNDTLLFKYKSGTDFVLVVNKEDYESCSVANPVVKLEDGDSEFRLDRSGPFYFITGNKARCDQGQKLIVVVLAIRTSPSLPSPSPSPEAPAPGAPDGPLTPPHVKPPPRSLAAPPCTASVFFMSCVLSVGLGLLNI